MEIVPASKAQQHFDELLDEAIRKPIRIGRRKKEYIAVTTEQLNDLLYFSPVLEGEPNDYVIFVKEIPQILGFGNTVDEAVTDLFLALKDYAGLYLSDFDKYFEVKNTKAHALYVFALENTDETKFKELINAELEGA